MTKEEARKKLEDYFNGKINQSLYLNCKPQITLPVTDETVQKVSYNDDLTVIFEQWSFKGLIKIAYDLEDKQL
jgi:hypothetical protein